MPPAVTQEARLLPPGQDESAASVLSLSDHANGSDSEDDGLVRNARSSAEIRRHDHEVLEEEAETAQLLSRPRDAHAGILPSSSTGKEDRKPFGSFKQQKVRSKPKIGRRRNNDWGEEHENMYELEGGPLTASSASSRSSSESDLQRLKGAQSEKTRRRSRCLRALIFAVIALAVVILFLVLFFGAYRATRSTQNSQIRTTLSNGTSLFAPTTILVSLDGFRADYLQRGLTPTLNAFIKEGASPKFMTPSFPSVTFPNHFTLVTGLYPESHGIVGNSFWDPDFQEEFDYGKKDHSMQTKWWTAEPIWMTAEMKGITTAIHMWPGSEAHIGGVDPTYLDKYVGDEKLSRRVERIMEWLDLPGPEEASNLAKSTRPQLIAAYVPNVDRDGHKYGPNSTEIQQTIRNADDMLAGILKGLEERNLTQIVNIIVISDHGMATSDTSRLIQLDDIIDTGLIEHKDGWPLFGLRPKRLDDLTGLYETLRSEAAKNKHFDVYLRDKTMPARYHFSRNDRIAPLWIVPKPGWAIVKKTEFDVQKALKNGDIYHPRGIHGYDNEHPLMRAIFIARGPAFPHTPGSRVEVFQNTEVYNIICDSIGLEPRPNNGTLRLPLRPVGLHTDNDSPSEVPQDPVESSDGDDQDDSTSQGKTSLLGWISGKFHALKAWAKDFFGRSRIKHSNPG